MRRRYRARYCTSRSDPESLARKNWTQHWWDFKRDGYEVFTSEVVIDELERDNYPTKQDALSIIQGVPLVAVEPAILEIVKTYVRHFLMPASLVATLRIWHWRPITSAISF